MKWLETQSNTNLKINTRIRLASQTSRGGACEELVVLYLLRALRYPVPFSTIFDFYGTPPSWADERAQIVGRLDRTTVAVDVLGEAPQNPGLSVVHYAANIEDVLNWLEAPATAPAVLIPSNLFGPDLMIWCGDVLLMGQVKSYTEGNEASLDAKTISDALTSLHPDHWFRKAVCILTLILYPRAHLTLNPETAISSAPETHSNYKSSSCPPFRGRLSAVSQSQLRGGFCL